MPGFHLFRLFGGGRGNEALNLDRPISNFDVAGVPTGAWSSSLFGCLSNLRPSCVLSFCLPCVMWSQVFCSSCSSCCMAQSAPDGPGGGAGPDPVPDHDEEHVFLPPRHLGVSLSRPVQPTLSRLNPRCARYRCFIDAFSWALAIGGAALVLLIVFHRSCAIPCSDTPSLTLQCHCCSRISPYVRTLLGVVAFAFLGALLYFNGHVRTAFKMKYGGVTYLYNYIYTHLVVLIMCSWRQISDQRVP